MIDFRYHLVSIVAVFLALAVGIVVGSTELQPGVVNSLRASAESASRLVATSSGYRAGLLGSIAASCTASYTVALVPPGPTP